MYQFAQDLASLRELNGSPSFARMHAAVRHLANAAGSKNTFHRMVTNPDRIYEREYVRGFVLALGLGEDAASKWEQRRIEALRECQALRGCPPAAVDDDASNEIFTKRHLECSSEIPARFTETSQPIADGADPKKWLCRRQTPPRLSIECKSPHRRTTSLASPNCDTRRCVKPLGDGLCPAIG